MRVNDRQTVDTFYGIMKTMSLPEKTSEIAYIERYQFYTVINLFFLMSYSQENEKQEWHVHHKKVNKKCF